MHHRLVIIPQNSDTKITPQTGDTMIIPETGGTMIIPQMCDIDVKFNDIKIYHKLVTVDIRIENLQMGAIWKYKQNRLPDKHLHGIDPQIITYDAHDWSRNMCNLDASFRRQQR